jgi:hypothetical protein
VILAQDLPQITGSKAAIDAMIVMTAEVVRRQLPAGIAPQERIKEIR